MTLACFMVVCFTACGGDDNLSADDTLSIDSTPVSFAPGEEGIFFLYDYTTAGKFVGAHKFTTKWFKEEITVNLRRGRHKLLWVTGVNNSTPMEYPESIDYTRHGTFYYSDGDSIVWYDNNLPIGFGVRYCEQEINVTDHIMNSQPISFLRAESCVQIMSTDFSPLLDISSDNDPFGIGTIVVSPYVKSVSLMGDNFVTINGGLSGNVFIKNVSENESSCVTAVTSMMLCPTDGLQNMNIMCTIFDKDGNVIPTTDLPKISIKRGYTTHLEGPLFSGSTSDWKVLMYRLDR